ncbi:type I restriction-modification enzyme R subunit C-terminal domain-containing protein [Nocardia sp. IBHARD005]|uniref:type I restriction-modification enzyme R subunit C-terminal domain-containing protein n=1 Tax=Nocardia sp. IBHARD005 TaxID=3457765 RepID=UPI0040588EF4
MFARALAGLHGSAVDDAFAVFDGQNLSVNQLRFLGKIKEAIARRGLLDIDSRYDQPFTSIARTGPDGLFDEAQIVQLEDVLYRIRHTAEPDDAAAEPYTATTA